jgi:hypothetical protein
MTYASSTTTETMSGTLDLGTVDSASQTLSVQGNAGGAWTAIVEVWQYGEVRKKEPAVRDVQDTTTKRPNIAQRGRAWYFGLPGMAQAIIAIVLILLAYGVGRASAQRGTTGNGTANGTAATTARHTTPAATAKPTATSKPKAWTTIHHFSGTTTQQTDTIAIPDGALIVWSCQKSDDYGGTFAITLNAPDGSAIDLVANTLGNDSGSYTLHDSGGSYFLKMDTYGENWTVDIQV